MSDVNLTSDEALDELRARLTPKTVEGFHFTPNSQGNYFCSSCFWAVLHYFAASEFLKVYISKNKHFCDNCGKIDLAKYRVILPYHGKTTYVFSNH